MVVDTFGYLNSHDLNSLAYSNFVVFLKKQNYDVSLLFLGPAKDYQILTKIYPELNIQRLPTMNLKFGKNIAVQKSYLVYKFIQENGFYESVYFFAQSSAYNALLAKKQGLNCIKSNLVVVLDALPELIVQRIAKKDPSYVTLDVEVLKKDFMIKKSLELADVIVTPSRSVMAEIVSSESSTNIYVLPYLAVPIYSNSTEIERAHEQVPLFVKGINELVFIGDFSVANGFVTFIEALEKLFAYTDFGTLFRSKPLKVVLIGKKVILDENSEINSLEYLEMRSFSWGNKIKIELKKEMGFKELVQYMTNKKTKKLAVFAQVVENFNYFMNQMIRTGIPVIASALKSHKELINVLDQEIFFNVNDKIDLSQKILLALRRGSKRLFN